MVGCWSGGNAACLQDMNKTKPKSEDVNPAPVSEESPGKKGKRKKKEREKERKKERKKKGRRRRGKWSKWSKRQAYISAEPDGCSSAVPVDVNKDVNRQSCIPSVCKRQPASTGHEHHVNDAARTAHVGWYGAVKYARIGPKTVKMRSKLPCPARRAPAPQAARPGSAPDRPAPAVVNRGYRRKRQSATAQPQHSHSTVTAQSQHSHRG